MSSEELDFISKVRKLKELEKSFIKFTYEAKTPETIEDMEEFINKAYSVASEAFYLRNNIASDFNFREKANLQINDPVVSETLGKIKNKERFVSINFYESLVEDANLKIENVWDKHDVNIRDYMLSKMYDELSEDFHSWFGIIDYYYAKVELGPIISSIKIPQNLRNYFDEIRDAYAFELYRSSISLSRALLEMAIFDKLNRKGVFKQNNPKVIDFETAMKGKLQVLIQEAKKEKLLNKNIVDLAREIKNVANKVLHLKNEEVAVSKKVAFDVITNTIRVVEHLYR